MALLKPEFKGLSAMTLQTEKEDDNTFRKESERIKLRGEKKLKWRRFCLPRKSRCNPQYHKRYFNITRRTNWEIYPKIPKETQYSQIRISKEEMNRRMNRLDIEKKKKGLYIPKEVLYSKGNNLLEYLTGFIFLKKDTLGNYRSQTHIIINVINVFKL